MLGSLASPSIVQSRVLRENSQGRDRALPCWKGTHDIALSIDVESAGLLLSKELDYGTPFPAQGAKCSLQPHAV
jgi:hypothetical protein